MHWTLFQVVRTTLPLSWNSPPTQPLYQALLLLSFSDHLFFSFFFCFVLRALTFVYNLIYVSIFSHAWSSWLRVPFSSCKEQGLLSWCGTQALGRGGFGSWHVGSVVAAHRLNCSMECGSSQIRDQTHVSCADGRILQNTKTAILLTISQGIWK